MAKKNKKEKNEKKEAGRSGRKYSGTTGSADDYRHGTCSPENAGKVNKIIESLSADELDCLIKMLCDGLVRDAVEAVNETYPDMPKALRDRETTRAIMETVLTLANIASIELYGEQPVTIYRVKEREDE